MAVGLNAGITAGIAFTGHLFREPRAGWGRVPPSLPPAAPQHHCGARAGKTK